MQRKILLNCQGFFTTFFKNSSNKRGIIRDEIILERLENRQLLNFVKSSIFTTLDTHLKGTNEKKRFYIRSDLITGPRIFHIYSE